MCTLSNYGDFYLVDDIVEKSEDEEAIGKLSVDEKDEVITTLAALLFCIF